MVERGEKIRVFVEGGDGPEVGENESECFPAGKLQMATMQLLIRAQLLICRRFEPEMSRLNYPAYAVLLECIKSSFPENDCADNEILAHPFAKTERAGFVRSAVELIYRTCLISPENAMGLVSENGASLLSNVLDFYIRLVLVQKSADDRDVNFLSVLADTISYSVHTLSGVAFYDQGREAIKNLQNATQFILNWCLCVNGTIFPPNSTRVFDASIKRHAIEGVSNFAKDLELQKHLVGSGVLWPLLRYLLVFDPTLDQGPVILDDQDDITTSLASTNIVAKLSVRALGCLSGQFGDCPCNDAVLSTLNSLLTPPIARMFRNKRSGSVLQMLNSNVERADIIWNIQMRNQLEGFLDRVEKSRPTNHFQPVSSELEPVTDFKFEALANEMRLGGVYLRFFNKGGSDSLAHVENAAVFFSAVVHFVGNCLNKSFYSQTDWVAVGTEKPSPEQMPTNVDDNKFTLSLEALRILCRVEGLAESSLQEQGDFVPAVLLGLLELPINFEVRCFSSAISSLSHPRPVL